MKVKSEALEIQAMPYNVETGEKFEPEEVPAQRVLNGMAPLGFHGGEGGELGSIPAKIVREGDAITFANEARSQCVRCKHFDQKGFREWIRSAAGKQMVLSIKDGLANAHGIPIDDPHLDHEINFLGLCRVFTEIDRDCAVTRPDNPCAAASAETPLGFFEPVTSGDEKISTAIYDSILKLAKGE